MSMSIEALRQKWPHGEQFCKEIRAKVGPRLLLAFSSGKDALASAIVLRPRFEELIPFYCYYVPGLTIIEEALDFYERRLFKRPIIRAPHPIFITWLADFRFQTPTSAREIAALNLPRAWSYPDTVADICKAEGLPKGSVYATGARAGEFFTRLVMCQKSGGWQRNRQQVWPIWDMTRDQTLNLIDRSGIPLSREYDFFHSSFCGLDYAFISQIKEHVPEDWETIQRWFPLIELEIWRYERSRSA